jgi:hypothetical protein
MRSGVDGSSALQTPNRKPPLSEEYFILMGHFLLEGGAATNGRGTTYHVRWTQPPPPKKKKGKKKGPYTRSIQTYIGYREGI